MPYLHLHTWIFRLFRSWSSYFSFFIFVSIHLFAFTLCAVYWAISEVSHCCSGHYANQSASQPARYTHTTPKIYVCVLCTYLLIYMKLVRGPEQHYGFRFNRFANNSTAALAAHGCSRFEANGFEMWTMRTYHSISTEAIEKWNVPVPLWPECQSIHANVPTSSSPYYGGCVVGR